MTFRIYVASSVAIEKLRFLTRQQYMAQNSFFLNEIDREATEVRTDGHLQDSLPGKGIPLKITQAFLKIFKELYSIIS